MPRPTDDLSDDQLKKGLVSGEFQGRDALIAEEILKRRHQENTRGWATKLGTLGTVAAALMLWVKLRLREESGRGTTRVGSLLSATIGHNAYLALNQLGL